MSNGVQSGSAREFQYVRKLAGLSNFLRASGYAFTTITPRSHAIVNARKGADEAQSLTDVFGWSRPFGADLLPQSMLEPLSALGLLEKQRGHLKSRVRFSTLRGQLFVHSAFPTEAKDAVFFGPDTYKFVDAIVDLLNRRRLPVRRAVDVCSGAGPGAVTVARAHPHAEVYMADINAMALFYGAVNAAHACADNVSGHLSDKLHDIRGDFDLIVAHPPYLLDMDHRAYRHGGGELGAALSLAIASEALGRLAPGGSLLLFTGIAIVGGEDAFRPAVCGWAAEQGYDWSYREVDPDVFGDELARPSYSDVDRIALIVFEATRPMLRS